MKNQYEIRGDVTTIILKSRKYGRFETLISTTKLSKVLEYPGSWHPSWSEGTKSFYVKGVMPKVDGKQKTVYLHRWITDSGDGLHVDHINHETLDNRDENLRMLTVAQNSQNRKGAQENNGSCTRGVYWNKNMNKWHAQIGINGKRIHLGFFEKKEEAGEVAARARMHHMPFSSEASV